MGYRVGRKIFGEMDQRERLRVAAIIVAEQGYRAGEALGIANADGEPRLLKPTDVIAARRAAQSNGMPEAEATDTIGKLWAHGFLDHGRFEPDLLRDAGRRYAAAYWFRYGPVCGKTGAYSDMRGGSGGPPKQGYFDEGDDVIAEARFCKRDDELRSLGRAAKAIVDQTCVDGQGDNDPAWLIDEMAGYPRETKVYREKLSKRAAAMIGGTRQERARAKRLHDDARRSLDRELRELRRALVPHETVKLLVAALVELAAIDRAEGLHKPKRHQKLELDD